MNYTKKLVDVLTTIKENENDRVCNFLLKLNTKSNSEDISEVDISTTEGSVKYRVGDRRRWYNIKIGRFINKFTNDFTPRDIEIFVNSFKGNTKYETIKQSFEMGKGKDFIFSYTSENYAEHTGSLGGSCMNNRSVDSLKLYVSNPKKINILMLKNSEGKLLGRAIVWKDAFIRVGESAEDRNNAESFKGTVLDRPYTTKDHYIKAYEKYAKENGWFIRRGGLQFLDPEGNLVKCRIKVNLQKYKFAGSNYPYLDTMRSISKNGTISNKGWKQEVRFY